MCDFLSGSYTYHCRDLQHGRLDPWLDVMKTMRSIRGQAGQTHKKRITTKKRKGRILNEVPTRIEATDAH
eukprot:scaffold7242_cov137-Cylindrotheca_fusiformis.AAC.3